MTCTIIQRGFNTHPLKFYHHLRAIGYTHRSAVVSVLMFFSPNKEDLHKRLERRREYYRLKQEPTLVCVCCNRGNVKAVPCPICGEPICQDCAPDFGAHVCEPV